MKELILIDGLSKEELFAAIREVIKQVLLYEFETITMLQVMECDRANQFAVRPNRLCGGWDFYRLCGLFKTELSARKDVVIKAWFQLPSDETMFVLPKGKYYYDLSDVSTDGIVASTGTRYCPCEKVDEESGAELMEWKPQGTSTYEPRPKLLLRPVPDGRFEVEKLTVWQKIKKRHAGFMDSHSAFGGRFMVYHLHCLIFRSCVSLHQWRLGLQRDRFAVYIALVGVDGRLWCGGSDCQSY